MTSPVSQIRLNRAVNSWLRAHRAKKKREETEKLLREASKRFGKTMRRLAKR